MKIQAKYRKKKKEIIELLASINLYEKTDETLIDELIYNYKLADEAKENIELNGAVVNVVRNPEKPPLFQTNQSVSIYNNAIKNITTISTKLGITAIERLKNNMDSKGKSEFENEFN
jgi:P27 family predicted phage terminase small subunit